MNRSVALCCIFVSFAATGCGGAGFGGEDLGPSADLAGNDLAPAVSASFQSLYGDYLGTCKQCHAPGAPGRTSDIEMTLDFTTMSTAFTTLTTGSVSGLTGAPMACNGVPFISKGKPAASLALAVLDEATRSTFDLPSSAMCDQLTITDETVKVGSAPSAVFLTAFRDWIQNGAANN